MLTLRLNRGVVVDHDPDDDMFEIAEDDSHYFVWLSFDEIEQIYTWAASVHERSKV